MESKWSNNSNIEKHKFENIERQTYRNNRQDRLRQIRIIRSDLRINSILFWIFRDEWLCRVCRTVTYNILGNSEIKHIVWPIIQSVKIQYSTINVMFYCWFINSIKWGQYSRRVERNHTFWWPKSKIIISEVIVFWCWHIFARWSNFCSRL